MKLGSGFGFYIQTQTTTSNGIIDFTSGRVYLANLKGAVTVTTGVPNGIGTVVGTGGNTQNPLTYEFFEFTVDAAHTVINLDSSQVDQLGIPINLQLKPFDSNFPHGTGIAALSQGQILADFANFANSNSAYAPYLQLAGNYSPDASPGLKRLIAPHYAIDMDKANSHGNSLDATFDIALYDFFNYYAPISIGGGGHTLYLIGNGTSGPEIFEGNVINNFTATDVTGKPGTYTVLQLKGTGYIPGIGTTDNTLEVAQLKVPDPTDPTSIKSYTYYGGATYEIFYPYFDGNALNSNAKSNNIQPSKIAPYAPNAPLWFSDAINNPDFKNALPLTSAGRMAFGASGVFADDTQQATYYNNNKPINNLNFDYKMLGSLENQVVTMLNRGITPVPVISTDTGTKVGNFQLREGYINNDELISIDLANSTVQLDKPVKENDLTPSATRSYTLPIPTEGVDKNGIDWTSVRGSITIAGGTQKFTYASSGGGNGDPVKGSFTISPADTAKDNYVTSIDFSRSGNKNSITGITVNFHNANFTLAPEAQFTYTTGPVTTAPHYAVVRLIDPYKPTLDSAVPPPTANTTPYSATNFTDFATGDLGPSATSQGGLTAGLVWGTHKAPESGMEVLSVSNSSTPLYLYKVRDTSSVILYSPVSIASMNTNILTFTDFYPVDKNSNPEGTWNAYAGFFHIGDPKNDVKAPAVDGRGYAFAFDDNGGYSSDISTAVPTTVRQTDPVFSTLTMDLLPWGSNLKSTQLPSGALNNTAFTTQPTITIMDSKGQLITTDNSTVVTMSVSNGATIIGTATAVAVAGVATFSDVGITGPIGPYTLVFTGPNSAPAWQTVDLKGQALNSTFGSHTPTVNGFMVQIANFDGAFTHVGTATANGTVTIGATGLVTVTGLAPGTTSTVTIATTRPGHESGSAQVLGSSIKPEPTLPAGTRPVAVGTGSQISLLKTDGTLKPILTGFVNNSRVRLSVTDSTNTYRAVVVPDQGNAPVLKVFDLATGQLKKQIQVFDAFFKGGMFMDAADIDRDGVDEFLVGAGAGGGPHVKLLRADGTQLLSFYAFDPAFRGGVSVAFVDVNNDGVKELMVAAGPGGGPHVKVVSTTGVVLRSFYAFEQSYTGGVFIAGGDLGGDGRQEIIVSRGANSIPQVRIFDAQNGTVKSDFLVFDTRFRGGVRVSVADYDGDGKMDFVAGAGPGAGPHVKIYRGLTLNLLDQFFARETTFREGVFV
ncbi:MAG: beta-1,3-glucanase family protein [Planctomycetota bacterium]|nr:beta-1,3-glucanase family protein [Planctomycetota bacterium]